MEKKFQFLREIPDGKISGMRLNNFLVTLAVIAILLCVAAYIIVLGIRCTEITKWAEMGGFVLGIATLVTGLTWMKQRQKKDEAK